MCRARTLQARIKASAFGAEVLASETMGSNPTGPAYLEKMRHNLLLGYIGFVEPFRKAKKLVMTIVITSSTKPSMTCPVGGSWGRPKAIPDAKWIACSNER